ncbi:DNA-binding transcriptional LysR family regulator [Paucibacter oligotrophus]|uniref:DNA-binding transcriptional LysR family regulator n=1 Tax=Roseateles oligotrophus TaxID=1769250 RepID=A0A840LG97_9BURK|nr:LysR family transcriptional regulator [Roseateles oligotrophus]MBB4846075.1 DNA-binding transcriptional LysR family regulator [Roseateles oligotrophus]
MSRQFDDLRLGSIELFCLTAQHQGFTAAAKAAGLTAAAVSRSVARLEERLGVRLLMRTTRQVRLTEVGQRYFDQCRQALGQLSEAEREASGQQLKPSGLVRMSLPTSYGHYRVLPLLPAFSRKYPEIEVEVQLSNRNVDFTDEGFDLAVRGRVQPDSGLVARKLEDAPLLIAAAPAYLKSHRAPRTPDDLVRHECIQFVLPSNGQIVPWLLRNGERLVEWPTQGKLRCAEDILGPISLARAGAGLVQTYRFLVEDDLREGRLVEVLADYAGASRPFSLLYPGKRHMPLRVRALIDFLLASLGPRPQGPQLPSRHAP